MITLRGEKRARAGPATEGEADRNETQDRSHHESGSSTGVKLTSTAAFTASASRSTVSPVGDEATRFQNGRNQGVTTSL